MDYHGLWRGRDYLAPLGDPVKEGLQPKKRSVALRASFFAPVRFGKPAPALIKCFLFFNLPVTALATLPETKNAPYRGHFFSLVCGELATTFEPFYSRYIENQCLHKLALR
jgi:hypothetical protein